MASTDNANPPTAEGANITKEFLEGVLKTPIEKLTVNPGSTLGDGYTCILYSVDVWKKGEEEPLHLLIKCLPGNAVRQAFLEQGGLFTVELGVYDDLIPELIKFQEESGAEKIYKLPFPTYYGGQIIPKEQRDGTNNPLDSHIIMTDLRKAGGFRLRDRFLGFDLDHYKLVIEAQATVHAVSWAYKCRQNVVLKERFPFLNGKSFGEFLEGPSQEWMMANLSLSQDVLKDEPKLVEAIDYLKSVYSAVGKLYYDIPFKEDQKRYTKDNVLRKPLPTPENEDPWEVLIHGDSWSNNMMFRYDPITGKPVEVVLVDLQICRESDPFTDVNYTLYVSTAEDLRQKHMTSMLHVYYDTFTEICNNFNVPPLPGWSWEELNRRFHRAQMYGIFMAACLLPMVLKNPDEIIDMENLQMTEEEMNDQNFLNSEKGKQMLAEMTAMKKIHPALPLRLGGAVRDMIRGGIL